MICPRDKPHQRLHDQRLDAMYEEYADKISREAEINWALFLAVMTLSIALGIAMGGCQ